MDSVITLAFTKNRAESPYFQSSGMNALLAAVLTTYGIIINNHTTY